MRGVVLLFLLSLWPGGQVDAIDQVVLANVVQEMRRFGIERRQYAMAVLLTQQQCTNNNAIFQVGVQPDVVREDLNDYNVYTGGRLIAAKPHNGNHAEYHLLNRHNGNSRMQTLLTAAQPNDCIVFFTTFSPCLERCNNPDREDNILQFMDVFNGFEDRKAFVFSFIWDRTRRLALANHPEVTKSPIPQVLASFGRINQYIPLYRCVSYTRNNEIVNRCYRCHTNIEHNDCLYDYN